MATPVVVPWVILAYRPPFLVPVMSLVGALLAGAVVVALVRRRLRLEAARPDVGDELARYRALYEQGALSEKEYQSLRAVLGGELRRSVAGPKPPAPDPETGVRRAATPDTSTGPDLPNTPPDAVRPAQ